MMFKCLTCGNKFTNEGALYSHIETVHRDSIPKNFSPSRYQYMLRTGKERGRCTECRGETPWNENTHKYLRMCGRQICKDKVRERANKNMIGKYGVKTLLNDPDHQRKMLANRSISGEYMYGGKTKIPYTGSYEKSFLEFMDVILNHPVDDIMGPSPNTYYYMYKGEKKFYIPDFYIPSLNLEIEIKPGGDNPNNHHKIQAVDKVKEKLKDEVMKTQRDKSYIKIVNKDNYRYIDFLIEARNSVDKNGEIKPIFLVEEGSSQIIKETTKVRAVAETAIAAYHSNDINLIESVVESLATNTHVFETTVFRVQLENHLQDLYDAQNEPDEVIESDIRDIILRGLTEGAYDEEELTHNPEQEIQKTEDEANQALDEVSSELDAGKSERIKDSTDKLMESTNDTLYPVFVLLTHTGTVLSNTISSVSNTEYSHSSISFDSSMRNLYSFGRKYTNNPLVGRFVHEDAKEGLYKSKTDTTYALYVTFVTQEELQAMEDRVKYFVSNKDSFKYNFRGLLRFKLGKKSDNVRSYFCSQFVESVLREGSEYFDKHSSQIQPEDFKSNNRFFIVSNGILSKYDQRRVDMNVELLRENFRSNVNPFKRPYAVYVPLDDHITSRSMRKIIGNPDPYETHVTLTLPTNLMTLREILNMKGHGTYNEYKKYSVVPIMGGVELLEHSDDSATVKISMSYRIDNINIL